MIGLGTKILKSLAHRLFKVLGSDDVTEAMGVYRERDEKPKTKPWRPPLLRGEKMRRI